MAKLIIQSSDRMIKALTHMLTEDLDEFLPMTRDFSDSCYQGLAEDEVFWEDIINAPDGDTIHIIDDNE